jgi:putative endopeptidase
MPVARPLIVALMLVLAAGAPALAAPKKKTATPKTAEPTAPAPCDDFYTSVNFAWLQAHPLPAGVDSHSRWDELNSLADSQSRELLSRDVAKSTDPASTLLADLVASASNSAGLDAGVRATAQPLLARIDALRKPRELPGAIAAMHAAGVPVLFAFEALRDADTGRPRTWLLPGGIGLPQPGYYTATAPEIQKAVAFYRAHQVRLLGFAGLDAAHAREQADLAFAIELALANAMAGGDSESGSVEQFAARYPSLRLVEFLQAQGLPPPLLSVQQPAYFGAIDAMLAKPNLAQWQAYLRMQVLEALAPAMAQDPRADWMNALALGAPGGLQTVTERMQSLSRRDAAELLSAAYAENHLEPERLRSAQAIAEAVRAAMGRAIDRAAWLSAAGKSASRSKLAAMQLAIATPADPPDFSTLHFERGNFAANLLALRRWNHARALARVDTALWPWPVSQATPVLGYQPAQNQLIVTAAALQPPAFEPRTPAADMGSFGALLTQQMSLAFADFTDDDGRALAAREQPLVAQFDAYPAGSATVNGTRTLRQDAADLAAIEIAFDAAQSQGMADVPARQDFYRAWAQVWARQDDPVALAAAQSTSTFAPARWRVDGPLSNQPGFVSAFACKPGQRMVRAAGEQASIWR